MGIVGVVAVEQEAEGRASPPVRTLPPNVRGRSNASPNRDTGVVGLPAVPNSAPRPRPHPNHRYRKGTMTGYPRRPGHGDGMAWPVVDYSRGDFACCWYIGRARGPARRHDPKDRETPAARSRRSIKAPALSPERRAPC